MPEILVGDDIRIRQVLINLSGNAIKFTDTGSVAIRVDRAGGDDGACVLRLDVQDPRIGIEAQAR